MTFQEIFDHLTFRNIPNDQKRLRYYRLFRYICQMHGSKSNVITKNKDSFKPDVAGKCLFELNKSSYRMTVPVSIV